jgi:hypothetical protein
MLPKEGEENEKEKNLWPGGARNPIFQGNEGGRQPPGSFVTRRLSQSTRAIV